MKIYINFCPYGGRRSERSANVGGRNGVLYGPRTVIVKIYPGSSRVRSKTPRVRPGFRRVILFALVYFFILRPIQLTRLAP